MRRGSLHQTALLLYAYFRSSLCFPLPTPSPLPPTRLFSSPPLSASFVPLRSEPLLYFTLPLLCCCASTSFDPAPSVDVQSTRRLLQTVTNTTWVCSMSVQYKLSLRLKWGEITVSLCNVRYGRICTLPSYGILCCCCCTHLSASVRAIQLHVCKCCTLLI